MCRWIVAFAMSFSAGCAHQAAVAPAAPVAPATPASPAPPPASAASPTAAEQACGVDADCASSQICVRNRCADVTPGLAECGTVRLHFPFNSAVLDTPERDALERSARCLRASQSLRVTIAGHTDERGTEEYNLALGQQRAASVAQYLVKLGVPQAQVDTVSYGKEKPLCAERDEACWARNRRATVPPPDAASR